MLSEPIIDYDKLPNLFIYIYSLLLWIRHFSVITNVFAIETKSYDPNPKALQTSYEKGSDVVTPMPVVLVQHMLRIVIIMLSRDYIAVSLIHVC